MQTGCNPNLSGDEGLDNEEEDDADWRMMRLERETWLKEQVILKMLGGIHFKNPFFPGFPGTN